MKLWKISTFTPATIGSVVLGALAGACFHLPGAWLAMMGALVALIQALQEAGAKRAALIGSMFAICFYGSALSWVWTGAATDLTAYLFGLWGLATLLHAGGLAIVCALSTSRRLDASYRFALLLPSLWVLEEWILQQVLVGEPWIVIGYAFAETAPFSLLLPCGGSLLLSWIGITCCGTAACWWHRCSSSPRRVAPVLFLIVLGVLLWPWGAPPEWTRGEGRSVHIHVLSRNVTVQDKYDSRMESALLKELVAASLISKSDLIVIPETLLPNLMSPHYRDVLREWHERLREQKRDLVAGTFFPRRDGASYYSGVVALGASGMQSRIKYRLVPFAEFVPLRGSVFAHVPNWLKIFMRDTSRGPAIADPFSLSGVSVAAPICYESAFGDDVRLSSRGSGWVLTLADDSWNQSPRYHAQAKRVLLARALELQKPVLRVANAGPSYLVSSNGTVQPLADQFAELGPVRGETPFVIFGHIPLLTCCLLILILAFGRWRRVVSGVTNRRTFHLHHQGQALPAAIVFMLILSGTLYMMVNTGQLVIEKQRVTNAADAAAYSAGLVQARAMNYDAYTNRAMIANQMAIAQYVSFASWINYFGSGTENVWDAMGEAWRFLWGAETGKLLLINGKFATAGLLSTGFTGRSLPDWINEYLPYMGAIIAAQNAAGVALSASQDILHSSLLNTQRHGEVAQEIARRMDAALQVTVVPDPGMDLFTMRYAGEERGRMADVVIRSRDEFTRNRNWTIEGLTIPFLQKDVALKRRGGTELIDFDQWRAVDTLEVHGKRLGCGKFGTQWCDDVRAPMAYSGADVSATGTNLGRSYHGGAYAENSKSATLAEASERYWTSSAEFQDAILGSPLYNGILPSRELRDPRVQTTGISIVVRKAQADTLTAGNASSVRPSGRLDLFRGQPGGQIASLARAEVYFDRTSPRDDDRSEAASLFNPYWRVRLVAPTVADRAFAASLQQEGVAP